MEETGVLIDVKLAKSLEIDLTQKIGLIEKKVQKKYKDLNTRSPLQLGQIFKKEVPEQHLIKKEKTLSICTDNGALESYKKYSKLAETLVQLRNFYKLRDTYCIAFCNLVDENNMLHGHFNQCGTITGRFSSSNPSLQVIPRTDDTKSPEAKQIRALFKIRPGFTNVYLDYAQIEYRMYAEYAEDEDLIKKINNGEDVHLIQACRIYGKTKDQISKQERWNAKITNFSVLYGASQKRIMEELDLEPTQAMMVIRNFYKENPKIKHLKYQLEKVIGIRGYFFNKFGRRRRMHLNESYKAINSLLQGVSADIIKVAMVKVAEILKGKKSHLELSVHDELVIALADTEKDLLPKIKNAMEDFGDKFKVKIETDIKTSKTNWAEKK
jgi:DNA polymerase-1